MINIQNIDRNDLTICAPSTAQGGAIGVIRVSGAKAFNIVDGIFSPVSKKHLADIPAGTCSFGRITDKSGELIDEVIVSIFHAPHSYTGENVVEISCHGSSYILNKVLELLLQGGCTMALPGEFTKRAFLNGKMDLSQAEAVADLISSTTQANHRIAMKQMRGDYSKKIVELRDKLLHITSMLELELDFSDHEELEFADRTEILSWATEAQQHIDFLCHSFKLGNVLKKGLPVAIIGETNAGKSTLLNALINENRALVSDIQGTTRDTIEECINMDGTLVRFIDTAGIRETNDLVEQMGIERTYDKIKEAEIVMWVFDATRFQEQYDELASTLMPYLADKKLIIVQNKMDLLEEERVEALAQETKQHNAESSSAIQICAHAEADISRLKQLLLNTVSSIISKESSSDVIVSNARHYESLSLASESLRRVVEGIKSNLSGDFISQDLRECIYHLGEIVGKISSDDVLHNIFSKFCVGK